MEPTCSLTMRLLRGGLLATAALLLWAAPSAAQFPPGPYPNPVVEDSPIADPGVLLLHPHPGSGVYYVVSTSDVIDIKVKGGRKQRVALPIWRSTDLKEWSREGGKAAPAYLLRDLPRWVNPGRSVWAPEIYFLHDKDMFVAYYTAFHRRRNFKCIGRATLSLDKFNETGRLDDFTDRGFGDEDALCNRPDGYSLIDASLFTDSDGERYLLYKRDRPKESGGRKEIVIRTADKDDGGSPLGPAQVILFPTKANGGWELDPAASVEAPTMVRPQPGGPYYLFYSGSVWNTNGYGVGVARSDNPLGGFERKPAAEGGNPILTGAGDEDFCGVGGQDVAEPEIQGDSWHLVYHAFPDNDCRPREKRRRLMVDDLIWPPGGWPSVAGRHPSQAGAAFSIEPVGPPAGGP
jgi:arabinan endo-1,5-alpha-L-arabinosidase